MKSADTLTVLTAVIELMSCAIGCTGKELFMSIILSIILGIILGITLLLFSVLKVILIEKPYIPEGTYNWKEKKDIIL